MILNPTVIDLTTDEVTVRKSLPLGYDGLSLNSFILNFYNLV